MKNPRSSIIIALSFILVLFPYSFALAMGPSQSVMTAGVYVDVANYGDYFVAANRWGIELFDVDRDGAINSISKAHTDGQAEFLDISGDLVAVSDFTGSIELFRIENRQFIPTGRIDLDFHPLELKIIENYLYIGGAEVALSIYDISNPIRPILVAMPQFVGYPHDFRVRNDSLFVGAYHGGILIFDITDKSNPVLLRQYYMPDFIYGIEIDSSYVYACAHQSGIYVLDLRYNGQPPIIGHLEGYGSARKAHLVPGGLLTIDGFGKMELIDLTRRSVLVPLWSLQLDFNCYDFKTRGDIVFLANWNYGVKSIILDGKEEATVGSAKTEFSLCRSLAIDRGRILAAAGKGGLRVFDRDLKAFPEQNLEIDGECLEIKVKNNKAFLSNNDYGFETLDLKDDGSITSVSRFKPGGWMQSSSFDGRYAFLANWQGIVSVDLMNNEAPTENGFYDTRYGSARIESRHDTLFVASSGGLELYSALDPDNIEYIGGRSTEYPALGISIDNNYVTLSSGLGGVDIIDLNDNLSLVSHINTAGWTCDADIKGNRLFAAEQDSGMTVWDISDIQNPEYLVGFKGAGKVYDMVYDGNRIYIADYYGVSMFELPWQETYPGEHQDFDRDPGPLFSAYPNPVVTGKNLSVNVAAEGNVRIDLYDILGRKVKSIFDGYSDRNLTVEAGIPNLPSGRYYVRVVGEDFSQTKQITLLK